MDSLSVQLENIFREGKCILPRHHRHRLFSKHEEQEANHILALYHDDKNAYHMDHTKRSYYPKDMHDDTFANLHVRSPEFSSSKMLLDFESFAILRVLGPDNSV